MPRWVVQSPRIATGRPRDCRPPAILSHDRHTAAYDLRPVACHPTKSRRPGWTRGVTTATELVSRGAPAPAPAATEAAAHAVLGAAASRPQPSSGRQTPLSPCAYPGRRLGSGEATAACRSPSIHNRSTSCAFPRPRRAEDHRRAGRRQGLVAPTNANIECPHGASLPSGKSAPRVSTGSGREPIQRISDSRRGNASSGARRFPDFRGRAVTRGRRHGGPTSPAPSRTLSAATRPPLERSRFPPIRSASGGLRGLTQSRRGLSCAPAPLSAGAPPRGTAEDR
jgi:hypothetical protein